MLATPHLRKAALLCILAFTMLLSCEKVIPTPVEDFSKPRREVLGDLMLKAIQNNPDSFSIVPNASPYDTVYNFVQSLYNQSILGLRADVQSPSNNRWDSERLWELTILDNEETLDLFILPGGHVLISTGFLLAIKEEYELYYLLSFEAQLMNERFLLNRLIQDYNSITLMNVMNDPGALANQITAEIITNELDEIIFDPEVTIGLDEVTASHICESSLYDNKGLATVLERINSSTVSNSPWLKSRTSYTNRISTIINSHAAPGLSCGDYRTDGSYQIKVIDILSR